MAPQVPQATQAMWSKRSCDDATSSRVWENAFLPSAFPAESLRASRLCSYRSLKDAKIPFGVKMV